MNIEGKYTLQAPPEVVWQALMDREILLRAIPGVQQLDQNSKHSYTIVLHVKQAPFKDTYRGHATISDPNYPFRYRLTIEGEGQHGTMKGNSTIHLHERNGHTVLAYKGTITVEKRGTRLPLTVVKGASKLLIQQFLTSLADQLYVQSRRKSLTSEDSPELSVLQRAEGSIVILPALSPAPSSRLLHSVIRLLKLGDGTPIEEALWEARLRRFGIISALLLLVWIGTRLPRR